MIAVAGYQSGVTSQFVSMDMNAGNCEYVRRPLTGAYLASTNGYWAGNINFSYSLALYEFTFINFQATNDEYASIVTNVGNAIMQTSSIMKNYDLGVNLILLQTSLTLFQSEGYDQMLQFTPTPGIVYNREFTYVTFGNKMNGTCDYMVAGAMNSVTERMTVVLDIPYYYDFCGSVSQWEHIGYVPSQDGPFF